MSEKSDAVTGTITVPSVGEGAVDPLRGLLYLDSRGAAPASVANVTVIRTGWRRR
ncbi:MAG TPA: hypothetical protein VG186_07070 [Solirubrobacteraceae bacterium]|nr:hypothetical protein [Solirubrobacteraceae bacterium]